MARQSRRACFVAGHQLGHGDTGIRLVPTLVGAGAFGGSAVVMAACGGSHTLVVTQDGALWACGCGRDGRLGLNDEADRHVFERVGAGAFGGARVVAAAAGDSHSAAVTEDGALWTWGFIWNETGNTCFKAMPSMKRRSERRG